ncbi:MAG TPA: SET domain-containing protein-lysine N-methyltransferase [Gemmatimonadales bacterium]
MPKPLTPRPFALRKSAIAGRGAFATRRIPKGACIVEYTGERIGQDEADRRYPEDPDRPHHTFLFTLDDDTVIDAAVKGNASRFINHSCDPNCEAVIEDGRIWIYALKAIREGEELVYDYQFILDEPHTAAAKRRYPCYCGAKNCRGTILAKKR